MYDLYFKCCNMSNLYIMPKQLVLALLLCVTTSMTLFAQKSNQVTVENGTLEGIRETGSGLLIFRGVPFAAPPVGELRWKEPQPAQNWQGVRKADQFGNKPMQKPIFGDMGFRSKDMSEDCLYLNVWTPAKTMKEKMPVLSGFAMSTFFQSLAYFFFLDSSRLRV